MLGQVVVAPFALERLVMLVDAEHGVQVLVADDHPTNRMVVELILSSSGIRVVSVADGRAAVEAFNQDCFDAVIMDVQMPVMDGLTAIRAIRDMEAMRGSARTPVHVLSTNSLPSDFAASFAAGADSHLTKPVDAGRLIATVLGACVEGHAAAAPVLKAASA